MGKRGAKVPSAKQQQAAQPTQQQLDHRLLINVMLLVLTFVVLLNLFLVFRITTAIAPEGRPQFELVEIVDSSCKVCKDIAEMLPLDVFPEEKRVRISFQDAEQMIRKYNITRVPALLIKAPHEQAMFPWPYVHDAYVRQSDPPFVDPLSGEIRGRVDAILIEDPACPHCDGASDLLEDIKAIATVGNVTHLSISQAEELMQRYGLTRTPSLILSSDLKYYPLLTQQWDRVGQRAQDGAFILTMTPPPYRELSSGMIKGMVNVTLIKQAACTACYDPRSHVDYLRGLGLAIEHVKELEADSIRGRELINRYAIDRIPTIVVSQDAAEYAFFEEVWTQLGTKEQDGSFVFRAQKDIPLAVFIDLHEGELRQGG